MDVLQLFAGPRRDLDYQGCVEAKASAAGIAVLVVSVDLAGNAKWDLAEDEVSTPLQRLAEKAPSPCAAEEDLAAPPREQGTADTLALDLSERMWSTSGEDAKTDYHLRRRE